MCVCEKEGVRPVSQRKQIAVSTSLMKTLSVSYTHPDNGRVKCIGAIGQ